MLTNSRLPSQYRDRPASHGAGQSPLPDSSAHAGPARVRLRNME